MVGRRDFLKRAGGAAAAVPVIGTLNRQQKDNLPPAKWVLFLVDRSGSMTSMQGATVKGLNDYINGLRDEPDLYASIVQFDSAGSEGLDSTVTFDFCEMAGAPVLTVKDYLPRGGTPLLAAMLDGIKRLEAVVRPQDKALLVVQTDGGENTSPKEITREIVKNLVEAKTAEGNWTFAFMGADIDAWTESSSVAIVTSNTYQYASTGADTQVAYATTTASTRAWSQSNLAASVNFYASDVDVDAQEIKDAAGLHTWVAPKKKRKGTNS